MAVEHVFGARTAWHCEFDGAASKVLGHHYRNVPNLRDVTQVDWGRVEPVDIMCGGYPCQPFSAAGQRKGTSDERHLWPYFAEAIRRVGPRYVVLENVAGHRSMGFDSVLADLAAIGYDAQWCSVRASDVGAPHRRERLFVVAHPRDGVVSERSWSSGWESGEWASVGGVSRQGGAGTPDSYGRGCEERAELDGESVESAFSASQRDDSVRCGDGPVELLSTPQSRDYKGVPADGFNVANLCRDVALLCTPSTADGDGGHLNRSGSRKGELLLPGQAREMSSSWGKYAAAIARWESVVGLAPSPTEPNRKGNPRLNPAFSEWMMGWPAGWVTHVPGITRNDQLRIIGNGVVPQQAVAALSWLLQVSEVAA